MDFATCVVANGKIRLRRRTGEEVPEGWLIDRDGHPTTNIDDYDNGGALLPAGGHKGYGLAVIGEIVGSAMLGPAFEFNWLIVAIATDVFGPAEHYDENARAIVENLRDLTARTRCRPGACSGRSRKGKRMPETDIRHRRFTRKSGKASSTLPEKPGCRCRRPECGTGT